MVLVELCSSLLAVRARLSGAILLYALTTEQLATSLMLPRILSNRQADEALQGLRRFREKVTVMTTSHCCYSKDVQVSRGVAKSCD